MNLKQLNYSMYMAANHLAEAGKHLLILDEEKGLSLLKEADFLLSIIEFEEEKMSQERLDEVLNEILNVDVE